MERENLHERVKASGHLWTMPHPSCEWKWRATNNFFSIMIKEEKLREFVIQIPFNLAFQERVSASQRGLSFVFLFSLSHYQCHNTNHNLLFTLMRVVLSVWHLSSWVKVLQQNNIKKWERDLPLKASDEDLWWVSSYYRTKFDDFFMRTWDTEHKKSEPYHVKFQFHHTENFHRKLTRDESISILMQRWRKQKMEASLKACWSLSVTSKEVLFIAPL